MDNLKSLGTAVHRATNKSKKNGESYLGLETLFSIFEAHGIEVKTAGDLIEKATVSNSDRAKVVTEAAVKVMTKLVEEGVDLEDPNTKRFMKLLTDRLFAAATLNNLKLENAALKKIIDAKNRLIQELQGDITQLKAELEHANVETKVLPRIEKTFSYKFVSGSNPFKTDVVNDLNMPDIQEYLKDNFDHKVYGVIKSCGKDNQKTITSKKVLKEITPSLEKITITDTHNKKG